MCYSALVKRSLSLLEKDFGATAIRTDFDLYDKRSSQNPKGYPPSAEQIFPGHYAPVIRETTDAARIIAPLRYGAYPPPGAGDRVFTTFNARRDNLTSRFWSTAFLKHHGFVVLQAFYEWVEVKDLLSAGVVTIGQVKREFERQIEERQAKVTAAGKKHALTPTEKKDPRFRKIIIQFTPEDGREVIAPAIINFRKINDEWHGGFAIVTDAPPPFVAAAGHDRCPVFLRRDAVDDWLACPGKTADEMDKVLGRQDIPYLVHSLPEAA